MDGRARAGASACCFLQGRGAEPKTPEAPAGPIVQESYGRAVPARTNTYLLKDRHDEALFDHYMTSQLATVALDGRMTPLGTPAVHAPPSVSPDGKYLLVRVTHRPYSYQVGMQNFPVKTEVWTPDGRVVRTVYDRPLIEAQPSMRDATIAGDSQHLLARRRTGDAAARAGARRRRSAQDGAEARSRVAC